MLASSKNRDVTSSGENISTDDEFSNDEYDTNTFNESASKSPLENEGSFNTGANDFSERSPAVYNDAVFSERPPVAYSDPDCIARPAEEWTSPFTVKKSWNYRAMLNDTAHPRIKISSKSKPKKPRTKKSPCNLGAHKKQFSSPHDNNILRTRLKGVTSSSRKTLLPKSRKKLTVALIKNKVNGLDKHSMAEDDLVPTEHGADAGHKVAGLLTNNFDGHAEGEYAQYLELKPSVKFKCCRCGINDFSSMALLQEHMASCDGRMTTSVTSNLLPELSASVLDAPYAPVARNLKIKRQVLLCSSCGTYYQHYNLYIHMRDTHNKQICLFCRNTFPSPQQLWDHLVATHKLNSVTYSNAAQVRDAFKSFYITCCTCSLVFSDEDRFDEHKCETIERTKDTYCSDCRSHNENEPTAGDRPAHEMSPVKIENDELRDSAAEEEPGEGAVENELVSRESTLDVIGVPEDHTVTSLTDEVDTSEVAAALDVKVDDVVPAPEAVSEPEHEPETIEPLPTEPDVPPTLPSEESKPVIGSPCLNLSEDSRDAVEDDLKMSTDENDKAETTENHVPPIEVADLSAPEPKVSSWLASEDEPETPDIVPPQQSSVKEDEVFPQPLTMALMLDDTVASLSVQALIKECVRTSCLSCLYCNNSTVIAIDGSQLASHLRSQHRYVPTKHEDDVQQVIEKIEQGIVDLRDVYMSVSSLALPQFDGMFACLQCSFSTPIFKDLCHHKRKVHHKVIFPCIMCKCSFGHYSQLLCHLCPGVYSSDTQNSLNYHCCFCDLDRIPSAFRLMVHLRKFHQACDICLARHNDQSELFSHMIKQHKMNHLCYKCNIAYRSRDGIHEHLFWKHGTESVLCKRCLQKKWPHAYHFCIPASTYTCEECSRNFTKAVALTVHRRAHNGDFPFACAECDKRFISKKLLSVHGRDVHHIMPEPTEADAQPETNGTHTEKVNGLENSGDEGKKRRKKKRKKLKTDIEKPLLDELPPLNLSSESEDDSAEEEDAKQPAEPGPLLPPPSSPPPPSPPKEPACPVYDFFPLPETTDSKNEPTPGATDTLVPPLVEPPPAATETEAQNNPPAEPETESEPAPELEQPEPAPELRQPESEPEPEQNPLERIRNCLVIEHSYCIPDSIFRSEGPDISSHSAVDTSLEGGKVASPKTCRTREKSCSKSITPRKRKHVGGGDADGGKRDSSSSDSSSDSDSSSSSCGSNCSCNQKSNSNCSSSSSGSEYSTTPDKKKKKKKTKTTPKEEGGADTTATNDEDESRREQLSLLEARESDLDTEISTSDEDFYNEYPYPAAKPEPDTPVAAVSPAPTTQPHITATREKTSSRDRKNRERRRAPKITINLGAEPQANRVTMNTDFLSDANRAQSQDTPILHSYTPVPTNDDARPGIHLSKTVTPTSMYGTTSSILGGTLTYTSVSSPAARSYDSSGRRSKRERTKNKFYGYSSSDEASGHDSLKLPPVKKQRPPAAKRPPKSRSAFVGIRAKKPLIMPPKRVHQSTPAAAAAAANTMAATHPSLPPHLYRMPSYITQQQQQHQSLQQRQQQQQQFKQNYPGSPSTNSSDDSDSDTLVINEPSMNSERTVNSHPRFKLPVYPPAGAAANANNWQRSQMPQPQYPSGPPSASGQNDVYCYCKCPYDEVSEMIACDGEDCEIEWFHFDCVGIMVAPKGKWYCKNCRIKREAQSRSYL